jgi:putative selenate reductase
METELPVLEIKGGKTIEKDSINYVVRQRYQVAVITDFCNECGNCATFCPTAGRPFRDKPRIYLNRAEYDAQDDNAFMVFQHDGMWMMQAKYGGEEYEMVVGSRCTYKSPRVMGIFDERTRRLVGVKLSSNVHDNMTIDLKPCAEMYALLKGLQKSASYLPPADSDERAPLK